MIRWWNPWPEELQREYRARWLATLDEHPETRPSTLGVDGAQAMPGITTGDSSH